MTIDFGDSPLEMTTICPHCRADNVADQNECWRCHRTLPTPSLAVDLAGGESVASRAAVDRMKRSRLRATIYAQQDRYERAAASSAPAGKRLLWLYGKRANPS